MRRVYHEVMRVYGVTASVTALALFLWLMPGTGELTVTFLPVGQGDAILIQGPYGAQVLVDGGPDGSARREIGRALPFWDRSLDAVVATHPDQDHIGGLGDIFEKYEIAYFLEPGTSNDTRAWRTLEDAVAKERGLTRVTARAGQRLMLGGGAYADILYPTKDVSRVRDTNEASIVMRIVYGENSVMLTGDAPMKVEKELVLQWGRGLDSDVLKAGHHGSKTSSLPDFVESVSPEYVVFSRGCGNRYGHPAPTVSAYFTSQNINILDTCENGTVTFSSDRRILVLRHSPEPQ